MPIDVPWPALPAIPPALRDAGWVWEVDRECGCRLAAGDTFTGWHDDPALAIRDAWQLAEPDHDTIEATERAERVTARALHYREALETISLAAHMTVPSAAGEMAQDVLRTAPAPALSALSRHPFLAEVAVELERAQQLHRPHNSAHESYAVLLEELEEFWLEVMKKTRDPAKMRSELTQLAAMAARAVEDLEL